MLIGVFTTETLCKLHLFSLPLVICCLSTCHNLRATLWIFMSLDIAECIKFCQYIPVLVYIDKNNFHFLLKHIHLIFITLFYTYYGFQDNLHKENHCCMFVTHCVHFQTCVFSIQQCCMHSKDYGTFLLQYQVNKTFSHMDI